MPLERGLIELSSWLEDPIHDFDLIGMLHGERPRVSFESWRTGDQRYYVSDTRRFEAAAGWRPRVNAKEGVGNLYNWLAEMRGAAVALGEPLVAVGRRG